VEYWTAVDIVDIVDTENGFVFYFRLLQLKCTSCEEPHRQEMLMMLLFSNCTETCGSYR
jgi:hypothetical protein